MIVVDASALLDLLLQTERAGRVAALLFAPDQQLHAPHLIDVEVTQVLRRLALAREIRAVRAEEALLDLEALLIERHEHLPLLPRVLALRQAVTAYDGVYIALAEALDANLVTCDARLARAHGHGARVTVVGS